MSEMAKCATCGAGQIPDTWFGECKRCYDMKECEFGHEWVVEKDVSFCLNCGIGEDDFIGEGVSDD